MPSQPRQVPALSYYHRLAACSSIPLFETYTSWLQFQQALSSLFSVLGVLPALKLAHTFQTHRQWHPKCLLWILSSNLTGPCRDSSGFLPTNPYPTGSTQQDGPPRCPQNKPRMVFFLGLCTSSVLGCGHTKVPSGSLSCIIQSLLRWPAQFLPSYWHRNPHPQGTHSPSFSFQKASTFVP